MTDYQTLLGKLDEFIRKYYKNRLIKGGILVFSILLVSWLSAVFLEYFGHFNTTARSFMFYFWVLLSLGVTGYYIVVPLLKLFKIGQHITYEQASNIIGNHFGEVKDKLLNALQLQQNFPHEQEGSLLMASIDQKIKELSPIPFTRAVNFKSNYKYIKYAAIPFIILVTVLVVSPQIVTESSKRIIDHDQFFEKKAPFDFIISSKKLEAFQNNDYELELKTQGAELPDEVYIEFGGKPYRMEKKGLNKFHYTLKNLQKSFDFRFTASEFASNGYHFAVLPLPVVLNFEIQINYPAYLNKAAEVLQNTGDITIPAGSEVSWKFVTSHVEQMELKFGDNTNINSQRSDDNYIFTKRFTQSTTYSLIPANSHVKNSDSMSYGISVVPDAYPTVDVEEKKDSFNTKVSYFGGDIADDYGLSRLSFNYKYIKTTDESLLKKPTTSLPININSSKTQQAFYHYFNFSEIKINPGDEIEYYFEVWDNDGVNGSKAARSRAMMLKAPTLEELKEITEAGNKEVKKELTQAFKEAGKLQKDLKKLQEKLAEKKNLDWQDKKQIEELLKRQKDLQKQLEQVQQENQQNMEMKQEMNQQSPELMQKQEELQKMMKDVLNEEMKDLMKQFEDLLKQNDKEIMKEKLSEMQVQDKEVQKELDRMLEMFKKLELEQKMQQTVDKLDELSKKQEELSKESQQKDSKTEDIQKKQDELNKEFKEVEKDLKDIQEKNAELEKPEEMQDTKEDQKDIEEKQEESKSELSKNQKQKAAKKQKEASDKMKQMKEKLEKKMQDKEQEKEEEDYDNLRQILENLLQLSFDQEALMQELGGVNGYNPQFVKIGQQQKKLKGDASIIEDSLLALSKRVQQISKIINKEIGQINANMDNTIALMADRNIYMARAKQQYVMTHVNNLAVMLSEVLKQMQDQMNESSSSKPGSKSCKKPGKKKKKGEGEKKGEGIKSMKELQDQLSKKIEDMKKGQKPGQGKPGENGQPTSKEFAQAAAMQSAIRQRMRQMSQQMGKEGATQLKQQLEQIQKLMDQNEKDLYNKRITPETLKRQQEIMSRMLESEKAQQERETDNQRKATEGQDKVKGTQQKTFEEYVKQKNKEAEILRTTPPNFNIYYKNKVKQYFDKQTGK